MPAAKTKTPTFSSLTEDECWTVLSSNHVGRLAFNNEKLVDIEPVSYTAADGWLFMRSADGAKLEALAHTPYVAFEVDEITGPLDWRSVVAHGTIYLMADNGRYVDQATVDRAVDALRSSFPAALTDNDPTPFRRTIYGLHVDALSGRSASSKGGEAHARVVPARPRSPRRHTPDGF
jgi:nitroimidazol reductase NimA-like FMN-containing flavoprotein (pyridoxamine 5'-phosphate oxidase superfamily)